MNRPEPATLRPSGVVERFFATLSALPGWAGRVGYRKLKRRVSARARTEFARLAGSLGPDDIVVDLGANAGEVTRLLAATGAEVLAFEPDPHTYAVLVGNVGHLPNVRTYNVAAGAEPGQAPILRPATWTEANAPSASKAVTVVPGSRPKGRFREAGFVEVIDFAAFLNGLPRPASLVKVDIEGAEWDLLDAVLARAPDRFAAMFVETHERFEPARVAQVLRLQERFRREPVPYVNLYWT